MRSFTRMFFEKPIMILLAVNIIAGLFIFRDYGLSWDEPLFYDYGNALGYAYSPAEWFSGHFDVSNSYGASGDDHKTRGPAYLFLAREPAYLLKALGLDTASAWHLVNFFFFQLSIYFLYRLATRWMKPYAALAASALFAWQPLLWGHAFINPKDPPFLTFFLMSVCLGFEMVDRLAEGNAKVSSVIVPGIILGITTSIRVLGPLAGLLVFVYFLTSLLPKKQALRSANPWLYFLGYGATAIVVMFLTWPFLWENPVARFVDVFRLMSDNPTNLSVLFNGQVFRAGELPRRYLPFMLTTTLTEPVWILFILGVIAGYWKLLHDRSEQRLGRIVTTALVLGWCLVLVTYVLIRKPAMYDGVRHFLFILPPVFIFAGFAFEFLFGQIQRTALSWLYAGSVGLLLLPGIVGIVRLHPYEYTYYNSFVGSTDGVFRTYETDYWLTCYKDAVKELNRSITGSARLYVHREAYIAGYYAKASIDVLELRDASDKVMSGDYILANTRTNEDRRILKDVEPMIQVGRGDALFCSIKRVP